MKITSLVLVFFTLALGACASSPPQPVAYASQPIDESSAANADPSAVDLEPPVPSFTSTSDCEQAYGAGSCGSGAAVYSSVGMDAPPGSSQWFIPYAFGVMTGVLVNQYFAVPGPYVVGVAYTNFTSTAVVNQYKVINRTTINNYNNAPPKARSVAMRSGPVRYSQSRGTVTVRTNSHSNTLVQRTQPTTRARSTGGATAYANSRPQPSHTPPSQQRSFSSNAAYASPKTPAAPRANTGYAAAPTVAKNTTPRPAVTSAPSRPASSVPASSTHACVRGPSKSC